MKIKYKTSTLKMDELEEDIFQLVIDANEKTYYIKEDAEMGISLYCDGVLNITPVSSNWIRVEQI